MRDGQTGVGVAAVLCALVLVGCTPDPVVQPTPAPSASSATPTESDAERQERLDYAAAEKAYRTFRAEYGRVLQEGGSTEATAVMKMTAGGSYLAELTEVAQAYNGLGNRRAGSELIGFVRDSGYTPSKLTLEACEDSRAVRILNRSGKQIGKGEIRIVALEVRKTSSGWKLWSGSGKQVDSCDDEA